MNPVSTSPSPEEIARAKAKAAAKVRRSQSCLVPIQPNGTKRPIFCIHPHAGVVFPYYELAFCLGEEQPFYGLQSVGIVGPTRALTSIESMATHYIKALRTVQPEGPYALGGWSMGAMIAFEMAQQLQQMGESVLLISLDGTANQTNKFITIWEMVKFTTTSAVRDIWPYVFDYFNLTGLTDEKTKIQQQSDRTKLQTSDRTAQIAKAIGERSQTAKFRQASIQRLFPIFWANTKTLIKYRPQPYPGQVTLLRSGGSVGNVRRDPTLGWGDLAAKGVKIINIPGHHLNILRQPHVETLAETLKTCLDS